ncbi:MAG: hypothetical protein E6Q62_00390 [Nitrosomonas sp.]|nr:MAG: hypothetical protein E6Q62_00390 [Nitrosomonas sp.]
MPGYLLHSGATVSCMHAGQAQATVSNPRVKVSGQPIVTQSAPHSVSGCSFNISGTPSPCVTVQWVSAALRVKAGGVAVLLQDSQATCVPNGTGVQIINTQIRVRGS